MHYFSNLFYITINLTLYFLLKKLQLEQLHNAFKKPDTAQSSQINHSHSSRSNHLQKHENKLFDTTGKLVNYF